MSWWCCCGGCWAFSDIFCCEPHCEAYPNLTDHWEPLPETSPTGNWWVDTSTCVPLGYGVLVEDGTPGAIIRNADCVPPGPLQTEPPLCRDDIEDCKCLKPHGPYCSNYMQAAVVVIDFRPGDSASLLVAMKDEANYVEARVKWDLNGDRWLEVWTVIDGEETMLGQCGPHYVEGSSDSIAISCCIQDKYLFAAGGENFWVLPIPDPPSIPCGHHGGLKHTASHQIYFTDWIISQTQEDSLDCPACGECMCFIPGDPEHQFTVPKHVLLTFMNCVGATGLEGLTIKMVINDPCYPLTWYGTYEGTGKCISPYEDLPGHVLKMGAMLYCTPDQNGACGPAYGWFSLWLNAHSIPFPKECCGMNPQTQGQQDGTYICADIVESKCNPFMLIYHYSYDLFCYQDQCLPGSELCIPDCQNLSFPPGGTVHISFDVMIVKDPNP